MSMLPNLIVHLTFTVLIIFNLNCNVNAENHTEPKISYTKILRTNEFENNNNLLASCLAGALETAEYKIHGDLRLINCGPNQRVKSIIRDLIDNVFQHEFMMPMLLAEPQKPIGHFSLRIVFTDSFESYMKLFQKTRFAPIPQNNKTYFIIILMIPDHTAIPINQMEEFFKIFNWLSITDINIMVATSKKIETYTFYPYTYGQCGSITPVLSHSCSENGQGFRQSSLFPSKNHNMNLCPLKTLAAHLPPFIILQKPFKGMESLTGIDGEILKVISRKMNFSIALKDHSNDIGGTVYNNGTPTGFYEILHQRKADVALGYCECTPKRLQYYGSTNPYFGTSFRLILKHPEGYSSLEAVFFPFSTQTWILFFIVNIIRIILLILKRYQYFKYLPKAAPNMIFLTCCLIAFTFRTAYESLFYNFMLHEPSKPLPRSFDDLRQQNYKIYIDNISAETAQNISELNGILSIVNTTPYEILKKFENTSSNWPGVLTNMATFSYFVKNKPKKLDKYVNLNVRLMDQIFCMYFPYLSDFTEEFNNHITQLHRSGLMLRIVQKFIKSKHLPNTKDHRIRRSNEASSDKILSLQHLRGPFIIFAYLQAIACGVFILEVLSLKCKLLKRGLLIFAK